MTEGRISIDALVFGAGIFGLWAARRLLAGGRTVGVVDVERRPLVRASLINQARGHHGYHYPRSVYTALRSASYYERFLRDFPTAVNSHMRSVYAVAAEGSYVDAAHFEKFCATVGAPATRIDPGEFFLDGSVEAAYETDEFSFDAPALRTALLARLDAYPGRLRWFLGDTVAEAGRGDCETWEVTLRSGQRITTGEIVNATYAGTNALLAAFDLPPVPLKYELCEMVLVEAPAHRDVAITVMDGPFFSLMPFGHSPWHSLSAVAYTPRLTSAETLPTFPCQERVPDCLPVALANCATCPARPVSSYPYMRALAGRFLPIGDRLRRTESMFAVKTVLRTAEVDDSRPTLIRVESERPSFVTLCSGKVNTIYDLDEAL
ncbi:FAD-dependent oxidoreductase [Micromonospora auratinigra]|uniref:FAD dependent oxidoreductase n=1 Tax=Micromonospora auratinigra TaxID=261654 RepID=A0A1A8Z192_9ACTN|nr:FAD-dependent oxidoreductase [Micromonospora auratinigra]SBT37697.1 FAD dependent oxidoreductase [Micromonospora auratinigra]